MEKTERGFKVYSTGETTYETKIHIVESSAAEYDAVWIQFEGHTGEYCAAHLDKEGAKAVIKGLQAWLKEKR